MSSSLEKGFNAQPVPPTLKFFYTDYCEGKSVETPTTWPRDKEGILHSMDCVLHMPDNFCGVVNPNGQTLQFVVEKDRSVTIDVPVLDCGVYAGSYSKNTSLAECLEVVKALTPETNFKTIDGLIFQKA